MTVAPHQVGPRETEQQDEELDDVVHPSPDMSLPPRSSLAPSLHSADEQRTSALYGGRVTVGLGVLGPVAAWDQAGTPIALKGPRHRAVLARLIVARGRVVPVGHLVDDLWVAPPPGAISAVRTFVAALRRALEPDRAPRTPPALLITSGPGYALRLEPAAVDAWRFEDLLAEPAPAAARLSEALGWWRGPAYADFAEEPWARSDRGRLGELRLRAVERLGEARLAEGRAAEAIPDLDAHVTEHPWREDAWRLLALALYRSGRQGEALEVLCRARDTLVAQLGLDPGPALRILETDILRQADHLSAAPAGRDAPPTTPTTPGPESPKTAQTPATSSPEMPGRTRTPTTPSPHAPQTTRTPTTPNSHALGRTQTPASPSPHAPRTTRTPTTPKPDAPGRTRAPDAADAESPEAVWVSAAADYDRIVAAGARARLDSTVGLLRSLAVTGGGGLEAARRHRTAAIAAAEELGDPELTARVIGSYDVPALWTRSDDPEQAAAIVAAARRALPDAAGAARVRLLATIALESRGSGDPQVLLDAREAVAIARRMDDPGLLAFALNGLFMQTCHRTGLAAARDEIGAELVELSARHGLVTAEVLGHLIRVQARSALGDFGAADLHAAAADRLADQHELPLAGVFTAWYRALRLAAAPSEGKGKWEDADRGARPDANAGRNAGADTNAGQHAGAEANAGQHTGAGQHAGADANMGQDAADAAYRAAARGLDDAGMPGLERGLLPLALLCLHVWHGLPPDDVEVDFGPYEPWARPLILIAGGRRAEAAEALRTAPDPPADLLAEALWCLAGRAAVALGDRGTAARAHRALVPAAGEIAGAGSGLLTVGPVDDHLAELVDALAAPAAENTGPTEGTGPVEDTGPVEGTGPVESAGRRTRVGQGAATGRRAGTDQVAGVGEVAGAGVDQVPV